MTLLAFAASAGSVPPGLLLARTDVAGAGAQTCAAFIRQSGAEGMSDPASQQWVLGYLAGRAAAMDKPHRPLPDQDGVVRALVAYCRAHPHSRLDRAAASLFERRRICGAAHGCR